MKSRKLIKINLTNITWEHRLILFLKECKRPATSVGGSVVAAELHFYMVAFNLGGGLHHGLANKANGFCYLNDLVFAIKDSESLAFAVLPTWIWMHTL